MTRGLLPTHGFPRGQRGSEKGGERRFTRGLLSTLVPALYAVGWFVRPLPARIPEVSLGKQTADHRGRQTNLSLDSVQCPENYDDIYDRRRCEYHDRCLLYVCTTVDLDTYGVYHTYYDGGSLIALDDMHLILPGSCSAWSSTASGRRAGHLLNDVALPPAHACLVATSKGAMPRGQLIHFRHKKIANVVVYCGTKTLAGREDGVVRGIIADRKMKNISFDIIDTTAPTFFHCWWVMKA